MIGMMNNQMGGDIPIEDIMLVPPRCLVQRAIMIWESSDNEEENGETIDNNVGRTIAKDVKKKEVPPPTRRQLTTARHISTSQASTLTMADVAPGQRRRQSSNGATTTAKSPIAKSCSTATTTTARNPTIQKPNDSTTTQKIPINSKNSTARSPTTSTTTTPKCSTSSRSPTSSATITARSSKASTTTTTPKSSTTRNSTVTTTMPRSPKTTSSTTSTTKNPQNSAQRSSTKSIITSPAKAAPRAQTAALMVTTEEELNHWKQRAHALQTELAEARERETVAERERNFYRQKLRTIEEMCRVILQLPDGKQQLSVQEVTAILGEKWSGECRKEWSRTTDNGQAGQSGQTEQQQTGQKYQQKREQQTPVEIESPQQPPRQEENDANANIEGPLGTIEEAICLLDGITNGNKQFSVNEVNKILEEKPSSNHSNIGEYSDETTLAPSLTGQPVQQTDASGTTSATAKCAEHAWTVRRIEGGFCLNMFCSSNGAPQHQCQTQSSTSTLEPS